MRTRPRPERLAILLALALGACAGIPPVPAAPADWTVHRVCGSGEVCVRVVEVGTRPERARGVALLVAGMFQSARSWDLLPEQGISFARFLIQRGLVVYLLDPRCIGDSDCPFGSDLDDVVIEDIPRALDFVARREGRKVIVFGQSQGSIALKASLAGLTRCAAGPCFDPAVAAARQTQVHAAGFFTGNLRLTGVHPLFRAASIATLLLPFPFTWALDRIPGRTASIQGNRLFGRRAMWFLTRAPEVGDDAVRAISEVSVDGTTLGIGLQLARGVLTGGLASAGAPWADHLGNIRVPVVQTTFEYDPLSPPLETWRDDFRWIGSEKKKFKRVRGQAHEDWMMNDTLHAQHWLTVEELIEGF